MTRIKKILFAALLIVMATLVFAACQKNYSYQVTFNPNNGTFASAESSGSITKKVIEGLTLPEVEMPTRKGFAFTGFYDSIDCIKQYYDESMTPVRLWDKPNGATLYAGWSTNYYTVYLDPQGGIVATQSVRAAALANMPIADAPSKRGFTFDGFYSQPNGQGKRYYTKDMKSAATWDILEEATLYAKWLPQYTVYLDFDGGNYGTKTAMVTLTMPMPTVKVFAPTKDLYVFGGYYSQKEGAGVKYYNADMTSANNWDIEPEVLDAEGTLGELRLYAYWIPGAWNTLPVEGSPNTYSIINHYQLTSLSTGRNSSGTYLNYSGITFILNDDINYNAQDWTPIGFSSAFAGTFEGNGHKISYLFVNDIFQYNGFFGKIDTSGVVKNLYVNQISVKLESKYEYKDSSGKTVKISTVYAGGLVGQNSGRIYNCTVISVIDDSGVSNLETIYAGGIAGANNGRIEKTKTVDGTNRSTVRITPKAKSPGNDDKGEVIPAIASTEVYVGGLVGRNFFSSGTCLISESYAAGTVICEAIGDANNTTTAYVGGLVGSNDKGSSSSNYATIQDCYSTASVGVAVSTGTSTIYAGGLVGSNGSNCVITRTFASGHITTVITAEKGTSTTYAGGLVGRSVSTLSYSFALGNIEANKSKTPGTNFHLGGLVGQSADVTPTNCYRYETQRILRYDVDFDKPTDTGSVKTYQEFNDPAFYESITWMANGLWDCSNVRVDFSVYPRLIMAV